MKRVMALLTISLLGAGAFAAAAQAGARLNPAFTEHVYHTHPAGMWMFSYEYMHNGMEDLRDGTHDVPVSEVSPVGSLPYGYMMTPTKMTMDMHMLMGMYGVTDRLTLMGMANYQVNRMDMLMNMGMGNKPQPPMRSRGLGDVELRGLYQVNGSLVAGLGLSLPTGDIGQETTMMGMTFRAPYDMQLGSGTVDLKPSLTYGASSADGLWGWGGQAEYALRAWDNKNDYRLGDSLKVSGWLLRALGPVTASLRLAGSTAGRIRGRDPEIQKILDPRMGAPTPDADPRNYGGQRVDGFVGAAWALGRWSVGVEGGVPLYQDLNGLQLKTGWTLGAAVQVML